MRNVRKSAICPCIVKRERTIYGYIATFEFCGLHDPQLHGYTVEYQAWATFLAELLYA